MKILIIDDSAEAMAVAKARLAHEGHEITTAGGGQEGLEAVDREHPDLILLDVDMPDMNGFEVCRRLKNNSATYLIPVIFLSGSGGVEDKVKGLDLGAIDFVTKPFDAFELRARVRAALRTKRLQDLLVEHAHIDPLTSLPNRRALANRLDEEWARVQRKGGVLSLIMADIDLFKRVNDNFGHSVGDRLLQEVAKVFATKCRLNDLPARYGGEEFAVLVPDETAADAAQLAERCRRDIEAVRVTVGQAQAGATASFGVADSRDAPSAQALIQSADAALYEAKTAGRNAVRLSTQPAATETTTS
jgi:two-component system, cell cycle response regulator